MVLRALLLLALVFAPMRLNAQQQQQDPAQDPDLNAGVQEIMKDGRSADFISIVDKMYTPYLESVGGAGALKTKMGQAENAMQEKGIHIVVFDIVKPYTFFSTDQRDYCVVPVHSVIETQFDKYDIHSFWLAIREKGSTQWQFLDGTALDAVGDVRSQLLPDLKAMTLPTPDTHVIKGDN